jgi:hypothetical protein
LAIPLYFGPKLAEECSLTRPPSYNRDGIKNNKKCIDFPRSRVVVPRASISGTNTLSSPNPILYKIEYRIYKEKNKCENFK